MCSYGGRILPRPHDNELRYVGGETHILVVSRNILFIDLMSKFTRLYGSSVVPKYQLPNEDLDVLVSIVSDEDLDIMMEEFDRLYSKDTSSKIRIFLYPPKQQTLLEPFEDSRNSEERFLDAVNGLSFLSKRHMNAFMPSQDLDFLFGLDAHALAKQSGNSTGPPLKSFISRSTSPALQSSVSDKESTIPLHSIAYSQGSASVSQQQTMSEIMLSDASVTEKPVISASIIPTLSEYSSPDNNQPGTRMYVPLFEVSRDQLPKGMVLRQYSVEDSFQSSLDSPVYRNHAGIADDLSDLSDLSLEEQIDLTSIAYAYSKELKRFSGKEGIVSGLPKNLRDNVEVPNEVFDGSQIFSSLRGHPFSNERLNLLDPNADLIVDQQHNGMEIVQGVIDHQNGGMSALAEYWTSENHGKTIIMQRRASDPVLSSNHHQQNMYSHKFPSNGTSGTGYWQADDDQQQYHVYSHNFPSNGTSGTGYWKADDDQQQYHDGAGSLPRNLVFLPRPVSTQLPAAPSSMYRVASAPNVMKAAGDALPPRYVAAPHAAQSLRHYDQRLPSPEHVPATTRSSSHAAHRSPSRFRDLSPSGFHEQPTSVRHQNSYHDYSVDATPHMQPIFSKIHHSQKPSKEHSYQGA
ncbi:hypothetical protein O6H91_17G025700 [Diphasiastrum complanatum]|nr:hypothetical protein O6H91_17G025700 [Diphasiastrum complanatum]